MNKTNRYISYFLVFVFGFLSIKNLFANLIREGNCQEFGHIHLSEIHDTHEGIHRHDHRDEDCHEGKSVLNYSLFPAAVYTWLPIVFEMNYDVLFDPENNFISPDLEPQRKPPRV